MTDLSDDRCSRSESGSPRRRRGPGTNPSKFHPVTAQQAWKVLAPKAAELTETVRTLPPAATGRHVVFEATLLPNYLASSYSPADMLSKSGLYVVGSRVARERLVTAKKVQEDEPTKTLLVAGRPDRVTAFAHFVTQPPSTADDKVWDRIRQFSDIGIARPRVNTVLERLDKEGTLRR